MNNLNLPLSDSSSSLSTDIRAYSYDIEVPNAATVENTKLRTLGITNESFSRVRVSTKSKLQDTVYYADLLINKKDYSYTPGQQYQQTQITLHKAKSTWLQSTLKSLAEFRKLPDNWDSYNSPRITRAACQALRDILLQIDDNSLPEPFVCPVPGGGLQLEWEVGKRELELEFLPDGSIEFLTVDKNANHLEDSMTEGKVDGENIIVIVQRVLEWLVSDK